MWQDMGAGIGDTCPVVGEPRPHARDVGHRVLRAITALLGDGNGSPDIDLVAGGMGTSVRTLQRWLQATGVTYTEVVQRARCTAAQRMLRERRVAIGDISRALGYSDPGHFTRAFHRWMGLTPRAFRARTVPPRKREVLRDR